MSTHRWNQFGASTRRGPYGTPGRQSELGWPEESQFRGTTTGSPGMHRVSQVPLSIGETEESPPTRTDPDTPPEGRPIPKLIAGLHLNSDFSDLTITCGNKTFAAHKVIVCSRSRFFREACSGNSQEPTSIVTFEEKAPVLIEKVLQFLYTDDYNLPTPEPNDAAEASRSSMSAQEHWEEPSPRSPTALSHQADRTPQAELPASQVPSLSPGYHESYFHLRMYGEADYFEIEALKQKALFSFRISFRRDPDNVSFTDIIQELYSERADYQPLKDIAIKAVVHNLPALSRNDDPFLGREILQLVPEFTVDLCLELVPLAKSVDFSSRLRLPSSLLETQVYPGDRLQESSKLP